ncbi:MAG: amino acid ABC transporter substrate-binding protein [Alphaproteobacteria bacterium]|jgi:glutamate/aspartate transport system substrate-binding protein|nr:amino acid ABC transporter substrate-binding protein [Alphaproteobacteria bacterium]
MKKRTLALVALLALLLSPPAFTQELTGTLGKIAATGEISIGYRQSESPFAFEASDGTVMGFSIDLCLHIVDKVRAHLQRDDIVVKYVAATPATRFILVKSGAIDLECAATTNNAERRQIVDFSFPHFLTASRFVSRLSDGIVSIDDLAGRTVASASGTVNIDQLNALNRDRNLNIAVLPTKSNDEAFDLVADGRASAFVMDDILLAAKIAATSDPSKYVLSTDTLSSPEPYGLLLQRGDEAFKALVNETLAAIYTSGQIDTIYAKWFTEPIPPNGVNLNLPMSAALASAFKDPAEYLQ